jgi:molybdopterin/thiamine biosynthesis adenylyltransferase
LETYDDAAFERFCSGLVNEGFSPVPNTSQRVWTGPIRASLSPLTDATRMRIWIYQGWPLRYAHVEVDGLRSEHASHGTICLWAEDDPAQLAGRDLAVLWDRLDEWAAAAQGGFRVEDRALDAYLLFDDVLSKVRAELPFGDLIRAGSNGYRAPLVATKRGQGTTLMVEAEGSAVDGDAGEVLRGAFYLRGAVGSPPRSLDDLRGVLTRRQRQDLDAGLDGRTAAGAAERSDGYDFVVFAWPRHDREHDAVVVLFSGAGETLKASSVAATPNDVAARKRRAGPDANALAGLRVLIAGAGSVGGHVTLGLAASGVETIRLFDSDVLSSGNLVRHVCDKYGVGWNKAVGVAVAVADHAPWAEVEPRTKDLPHNPNELAAAIDGFDAVIDCTGRFSLSAALAEVCRISETPLISGALFHQGAIARIQRQAEGDTLIAARPKSAGYYDLPAEESTALGAGFLELGCTAPVNNAPPVAVVATAADIVHATVDMLTGRKERPDERIVVFRPMVAPFDRTGTVDPPAAGAST